MEFGEAFGAIPALEEESLAARHLGQSRGEIAGFAGKDQRRIGLQARLDGRERRGIGILRHLLDRLAPPRAGGPGLSHDGLLS